MTDEEIAELVAENQRLRAMTDAGEPVDDAPIIVEATEPPPVSEQVQVIEAQAEAEQPKGDDDDTGGLFMPEADHWYFKKWGKK